jgi:hypothetical protein
MANTDGIINKLVTIFALLRDTLPGQADFRYLLAFLVACGLDRNKIGTNNLVPGLQKLRRTSLTTAGTRIR